MPLCAAFIFKDVIYSCLRVYDSVCVYACSTDASRGQKGASDLPVVGVTGSCEPLVGSAGNRAPIS